jgi:ubiquinone/menaquinone biosynthesis C-methylase UbiE
MTENKDLWDAIANEYDARMSDDGNDFHQKLIRPATVRLLNPKKGERVLDIACGNGIFERYLAAQDVTVVAFDFSTSMIARAKERCADYLDHVDFFVADATDYNQLIALGGGKPFDKAVANMAVMGFPQIEPLFRAVYEMLKPGGVFVFSVMHPCFQTPGIDFTEDGNGIITRNYIEWAQTCDQVLSTSDKCTYHWHRPLSELLRAAFSSGFVMDSIEEPIYDKGERTHHAVWENVPLAIVVRLRKQEK